MKNWRQYKEKCTEDRPEVAYKSQFMICPEPHVAIAISEIMHDTELSARSLINTLLDFALDYVEFETKTIKRIKIVAPSKEGSSDD